MLKRIAEEFGVSIDYLLGITDEERTVNTYGDGNSRETGDYAVSNTTNLTYTSVTSETVEKDGIEHPEVSDEDIIAEIDAEIAAVEEAAAKAAEEAERKKQSLIENEKKQAFLKIYLLNAPTSKLVTLPISVKLLLFHRFIRWHTFNAS